MAVESVSLDYHPCCETALELFLLKSNCSLFICISDDFIFFHYKFKILHHCHIQKSYHCRISFTFHQFKCSSKFCSLFYTPCCIMPCAQYCPRGVIKCSCGLQRLPNAALMCRTVYIILGVCHCWKYWP